MHKQARTTMTMTIVAIDDMPPEPELGGAAKLRAMDVPVRTLISFAGH